MSEQTNEEWDRQLRMWAVERACENVQRRTGISDSPAQRRKDILTMAKEFEDYVRGAVT